MDTSENEFAPSFQWKDSPIRLIFNDTLIESFKFLSREELCDFSSVSRRFFSLTNHSALPNLLLIDEQVTIELLNTGDLKYLPQAFVRLMYPHLSLSLLFDGEQEEGITSDQLRSKAIEIMDGNSKSIEVTIGSNDKLLLLIFS